MKWEDFIKSSSESYMSLENMSLAELEQIKKRCGKLNITIPQLKKLVIEISNDFNLSPKDAFKLVQNKGYIQ